MASVEVIDLVSSDDEVEVEVVFLESNLFPNGKRGQESEVDCVRENKSEDSNHLIGNMSQALSNGDTTVRGNKKRRSIEDSNHLIENMGQALSNGDTVQRGALSSDISNSENGPQVVFDDDGNDNAVITYGILEVLDGLNIQDALSCAGQRSRDSHSCPKSSTVQHIQQNDKWSCGFRNLQMMFSALLPHLQPNHAFFHVVPRRYPNPTIPGLRQIQSALEQSWKAGFDASGAKHYSYKIVGQQSKIGAVEVSTVMSYLGLDSTVVQFIKCRESRELLPKFVRAYFSKALGKEGCPFCSRSPMGSYACAEELLQFASAPDDLHINIEPGCDCPILPLYLQWEGHSVTIIGIDPDSSLLIFDPMKKGNQIKKDLETKKTLGAVRLSSKHLLNKEIQVILCSMRSLTQREKESRRDEPSVATAANEAVLRAIQS